MRIRFANADDLPQLPALERAAAAMFANSPYPQLVHWSLASEEIQSGDVIFVAEVSNELAGFVIVRPASEAMHIQEIDVHPNFARRRVGALLIDAVEKWTRTQGLLFVTLTTFDDVPWNGPYYARLGYSQIERDAISPALQTILLAEEKAGIAMAHRICMQKEIVSET